MSTRKTLTQIMSGASAACRRRNPVATVETAEPSPAPAKPKAPRRPAAENKSEQYWHRRLIEEHPGAHVVAQAKGYFVLPGTSDTYTPDLMVVHGFLPIEVWEVKGGYRGPGYDQGLERYKRTAQEFSDGVRYQFYLAEKSKTGWTVRKWNNTQHASLPNMD